MEKDIKQLVEVEVKTIIANTNFHSKLITLMNLKGASLRYIGEYDFTEIVSIND